jgi:hypothetical protein
VFTSFFLSFFLSFFFLSSSFFSLCHCMFQFLSLLLYGHVS